jgi:transposase-like protein
MPKGMRYSDEFKRDAVTQVIDRGLCSRSWRHNDQTLDHPTAPTQQYLWPL